MIESKNNLIHEFTGMKAQIIKSTNKQIIGQSGIIINETKNMFLLKTKFGLKQIPKSESTWKFITNRNEITINGNLLLKRPYEILVNQI